jgi:hypothetical protein
MDVGSIVTNLVSSAIWTLLAIPVGLAIGWWRSTRKVMPVSISVRKVNDPPQTWVKPKVLIATFSGYRRPREMSEDEFAEALSNADLSRLPLDENTPSIGQIIRVLKAYPGLEEVYLLSTRSKQGPSSIDSVSLIRAYVESVGMGSKVIADERCIVDLDEDNQVTEDAFRVTKNLISVVRVDRKGGDPNEVLVDVTSSTRAMSTGALLACLRPDQKVHLIGCRYDDQGNVKRDSSFPMILTFRPKPWWERGS